MKHVSQSMACDPRDAIQRNRDLHERGIRDSYFDPKTGDLVHESRGARKKFHKEHGLFDRDAGYGDQAPS